VLFSNSKGYFKANFKRLAFRS